MQLNISSNIRFQEVSDLGTLLLYAVCFTEALTSYALIFSNSVSKSLFTPESKLVCLSLFFCLLSAGMLLFTLTSKETTAKRLPTLITGLCILRTPVWCALACGFNSIFLNMALSIFYAMNLGYISAFAFYRGLKQVTKDRYARFIAFSIALAVLVTMLAGKLSSGGLYCNFILGLICQVVIFYFSRLDIKKKAPNFQMRKLRVSFGMRRYLRNSIIMVSIMSFLHGMSDGVDYFIFMNASVDVVHEYYRLLYVLTLIIAGILYDRFKYYQMLAAIIASGALLINLQLYNTEYYCLVHYIDSISSGFIQVFIMNIFAEVSVVLNREWLWCNLGRIIEFAVGSIGSVSAVCILSSRLPGLSITLFVFILLQSCLSFMLYHGSMHYQVEKQYRSLTIRLNREIEKKFNVTSESKDNKTELPENTDKPISKPGLSESSKQSVLNAEVSDERKNEEKSNFESSDNKLKTSELNNIVNKYALTSKETEIISEIIELKTIRDMALDLGITERTVKYRISRILEKTDTKNQKELIKKINKSYRRS